MDRIALRVFRRDAADTEKAFTLIKLDDERFRLPAGWRGHARESPARRREYDVTIDAVRTAIATRLQTYGGNPDFVTCEIISPRPHGGRVPHGDVVALLDAFLQVGLEDVLFEGAPTPLTPSERAKRDAAR